MLSENAKAWVAALRSGRYKQGTEVLHRRRLESSQDEYCCLGVACEMAAEAGVTTRSCKTNGEGAFFYGNEHITMLPESVIAWLGLSTCNGNYFSRRTGHTTVAWSGGTLAGDNDTGKTFKEIATLIESEPPGLFLPAQ